MEVRCQQIEAGSNITTGSNSGDNDSKCTASTTPHGRLGAEPDGKVETNLSSMKPVLNFFVPIRKKLPLELSACLCQSQTLDSRKEPLRWTKCIWVRSSAQAAVCKKPLPSSPSVVSWRQTRPTSGTSYYPHSLPTREWDFASCTTFTPPEFPRENHSHANFAAVFLCTQMWTFNNTFVWVLSPIVKWKCNVLPRFSTRDSFSGDLSALHTLCDAQTPTNISNVESIFHFSCAKPLLVSEQQIRMWTQPLLRFRRGKGIYNRLYFTMLKC